jgi:uncharacterized protein (TIGR02757 family)
VERYNQPWFVEQDPISIPHRYFSKEDIEIAGFLTATISWGNRRSILDDADRMMKIFGSSPYDFVRSAGSRQLQRITGCIHRTFQAEDLRFFIRSLRRIYEVHEGMEDVFRRYAQPGNLQPAISRFRELFFSIPHPQRTIKHVSDPERGSAAKRINMMLRWFVRRDNCGVDFGIWNSIDPSWLSCPLDVHSGKIARELGLLHRKQNDARAVKELDQTLRYLDPIDPVRYDFALFGIGVNR